MLIATYVIADQPLKIWITPPKGMTLKNVKSGQYNWKNDRGSVVDDFQVNDDPAENANQWAPAVAADREGNSIVVWEDWRNGNCDIYAQVLDSEGQHFGPNFKINDDRINAAQKDATVIATLDNRYMIVWRDDRNGNNDIFAQFVSRTGQPAGTNFLVHESNTADQMNPSVAQMTDGSYVFAWEDWRNGNIDIFARKISATGQPIGGSYKVNSDFTSGDQTTPKVACDNVGHGIIVWRDLRHAKSMYDGADIYGQKLNHTGGLEGPNFRVNADDNGKIDQCNPDIAMSNQGEAFVVWRDNRHENLDIYGQVFDANGIKRGNNIRVNDDESDRAQRHPTICINGRGEFMVVWADRRNENFDIYAQCFRVTGQRIGINFKINDTFGSDAIQNEPVIDCDPSGNLVMGWVDYRFMNMEDHKTDVFAQRSYFDNLLDVAEGKDLNKTPRNLTTHQSN